jgi:hypothetical protein
MLTMRRGWWCVPEVVLRALTLTGPAGVVCDGVAVHGARHAPHRRRAER